MPLFRLCAGTAPETPAPWLQPHVNDTLVPADAQQGSRGHRLLLDHQDPVHDGRRELRRLHQRDPRLRPDQHHAGLLGRAWRSRWSRSSGCDRYVPGVYWLAVVLISVVGTLLTDNLTDARGVPLWISYDGLRRAARRRVRDLVRPRAHPVDPLDHHHPARGLVLAVVLVTFALGTAVGDWTLELTGWSPGCVDPAARRPDPRRVRRLEAGRRSGAVASGWPTS